MNVLGLIVARGGSKGIPRKNIVPLLGKPLLAYTAEAALASTHLRKTIISTDSEEIADVAKGLGLEVPFLRPAHLAQDNTRSIDVIQHAIRWCEARGEDYDALFLLQPTNPLRLTSDIDGAIELLERTGADSVISFADVGERHPARMKYVAEDLRVIDPPFAESVEGAPRQGLDKLYLRDGSVYVTRRDVIMEQNSIKGADCRAWIMPPERAWNVDAPLDLVIIESLLKNLRQEGNL